MIVGSLDKIVFACSALYLKTFKDLKQKCDYRWIEHSIIGSKPKLQYDGANLETINFNIILSAAYNVNPILEVKKLKKLSEKGKKVKLILGGEVLGDYAILKIDNDYKEYTSFGTVTRIDIAIELKEYN